ncbi:hypothetical protein H2204_003242 [Knufia peltigerae]|uniref:Rieske domain-containing protein n=1 Tax=Knufia peltigerae TaxID=1002370 RepID=A0AA38YBA7_9EURO|nr:hypothetical protein H2204_003242 [Knufia peltigerae]
MSSHFSTFGSQQDGRDVVYQLSHWVTPAVLTVTALVVSLATFRVLSSRKNHTPASRASFPRGKLSDFATTAQNGDVTKVSDLPDGWWTSETNFDDEKRSVLVKMPIAVAHASMFRTPGSYRVVLHPAGFPLFLVLGKDRVLRCFHNVCRHRAYPVVSTKQVGCTPVLSCRYHGWSYDLKGRLVKAPKFDGLKGFRPEQNSLFEVYVRTDGHGFIHVDLSLEPRSDAHIDTTTPKRFVESWDVEGAFNWKFAESTDAFSLPSISPQNAGLVKNLSQGHEKPSIMSDIFTLRAPSSYLLITIFPSEAAKCKVTCTVVAKSSESATSSAIRLKSDVAQCISRLEELHAKVGASNTTAPSAHDLVFLEMLHSHLRMEREIGRKSWPVLLGSKENSTRFNAAETLCRDLEVDATRKKGKGSLDGINW